MNVDRRRTPHSVEWAGAMIMVLVGYMLSNYLILLGGVIAIVTKTKMDAIQEKIRVQTLPLRAIRDGAIHKDEMSK